MLPTIQKLKHWKNAQIVRIEHFQLFFSLHDDCPTCRGLIGFKVDGHPRVVCDVSSKRGGLAHTTAHRKYLQPDISKWLTPAEFAKTWIDQTGLVTSAPGCSGPGCGLPTIGFFTQSISAKFVAVGTVNLYFSYENSGHWPDIIAFNVEGEPAVVCDASQWPSAGHGLRTKKHRGALEPDTSRWLSPTEFHRKWLSCAKALR